MYFLNLGEFDKIQETGNLHKFSGDFQINGRAGTSVRCLGLRANQPAIRVPVSQWHLTS